MTRISFNSQLKRYPAKILKDSGITFNYFFILYQQLLHQEKQSG